MNAGNTPALTPPPAPFFTVVDGRISKLFAGETDDPDRIPIQRQEQYDAIIQYGGMLLYGEMEVPRFITDPVAFLTDPGLLPPDVDPDVDGLAQIYDWISGLVV